MFTCVFLLAFMVQPVNVPSISLSKTTSSSWCSSLLVSHRLGDEPNILDLFQTSNPSPYTVKLIHLFVSPVTLSLYPSIISSLPQERPPTSAKKRLWNFGASSFSGLRSYFFDFPWNDYCFRGRSFLECAERITEVIFSGMEAYIPYFFPSTKSNNPWFNSACSRAIRRRDAALRDYHRLQIPETHATYISPRNRAKCNTKNSFLLRKCNNSSDSSSSSPFWHFAKMSTLTLLLSLSLLWYLQTVQLPFCLHLNSSPKLCRFRNYSSSFNSLQLIYA